MAKVNNKLHTLVIMGDRCGNCGQYFSLYGWGPTRTQIAIRHMCPPRTKKVKESFGPEYPTEYLKYKLEQEEFRLMWGSKQHQVWTKDTL